MYLFLEPPPINYATHPERSATETASTTPQPASVFPDATFSTVGGHDCTVNSLNDALDGLSFDDMTLPLAAPPSLPPQSIPTSVIPTPRLNHGK